MPEDTTILSWLAEKKNQTSIVNSVKTFGIHLLKKKISCETGTATLLVWAVIYSRTDIVEWLLSKGAKDDTTFDGALV